MSVVTRTYYHVSHVCALMLIALLCAHASALMAQSRPYRCEIGVQGGAGYYIGDASEHVFQNIREAYGLQFRYKFDKRWALAVKANHQRITGPMDDLRTTPPEMVGQMWSNRLINVDVMGEFNFLRLSDPEYDHRVKCYSPFITLGVGATYAFEGSKHLHAYIPVGLGFKWKFARRAGLNILWQHNIMLTDGIEGIAALNNTHDMNGSNIMNLDVTSTLTLGIVFEFAQQKKVCRTCND